MTTMKHTALAAGVALAAVAGQAAAQDVKQLRLAHSHQPNMESEEHFPAKVFQDYVEENSDTLEVSIHAAGSLGSEREVLEAMQLGGGASCLMSGTAILSNFTPRIAVLDLPFIWQDYDHVHRALDGTVGEELEADLEGIGLELVAWMDSWGYRNLVTSEPIESEADLQGRKIRTIQTPVYIATVEAMGAEPTPMAFEEVYSAMETGVIDGLEHGFPVIRNMKFYEVADHITITEHLFGPLAFTCAKSEWDGYTEDERRVIEEAAVLAQDVNRGLATMREERARQWLVDQGMTVSEIDTTAMQERAREVQDRFAEEAGATDLLEEVRRLRDEEAG